MTATEDEVITIVTIDPQSTSPPAPPPAIILGGTSLAMTNTTNTPFAEDAVEEEAASTTRMKTEHLGSSRQYWRDIILGVNDGLVSTFLLVAGVAGGGMSSDAILLTALAGALAGAISMMAGEFVATKSQNEVLRGELKLERVHVETHLEEELAELSDLLELIGLPGGTSNSSTSNDISNSSNLKDPLMAYYRENPDALLKAMTALEFGVIDTEMRSPIVAGLSSCCLFICGSLPSVLPFVFSGDRPLMGFVYAAIFTTLSLLLVGAVKTWATRGKCLTSALENLVIASCGATVAYFVGELFDRLIGGDGGQEPSS